jgi:hypothetical protein
MATKPPETPSQSETRAKNSQKCRENDPDYSLDSYDYDFQKQLREKKDHHKAMARERLRESQQTPRPGIPNQVFQTDNEISKARLGKQQKTFQKYAVEGHQGGHQLLENEQSEKFDQFSLNKKLFNTGTHFDENEYSTQLDLRHVPEDRRTRAERLEAEIIGSTTKETSRHLKEERGQADLRDNEDEEALYSAVVWPKEHTGEGRREGKGRKENRDTGDLPRQARSGEDTEKTSQKNQKSHKKVQQEVLSKQKMPQTTESKRHKTQKEHFQTSFPLAESPHNSDELERTTSLSTAMEHQASSVLVSPQQGSFSIFPMSPFPPPTNTSGKDIALSDAKSPLSSTFIVKPLRHPEAISFHFRKKIEENYKSGGRGDTDKADSASQSSTSKLTFSHKTSIQNSDFSAQGHNRSHISPPNGGVSQFGSFYEPKRPSNHFRNVI